MRTKLFSLFVLLFIGLISNTIMARTIEVYLQNNYGSPVEYAYNFFNDYGDQMQGQTINDNERKKIDNIETRFGSRNKLHIRRPGGIYHTRDLATQILKEQANHPDEDVLLIINPRGWLGALKSWDITINWIKKQG